jgi:hypothetical protein
MALSYRRRAAAATLGALLLLAAGPSFAGTQVLAPSDDTFINSGNPNNNNGGSTSVFIGGDGHGGAMRTLIRFAMPPGFQGRATVTGVQLRLTIRQLPNGTIGPGAVDTLAALTEPWVQGNGTGEAPSSYTVGLLCSGTVTGATWNQTNCTTATAWTSPGGTVATSPSGQVDTTGVPAGAAVVWDSGSNPGMTADVQSWIDAPAGNNGWRITSSVENVAASTQRFFSTEFGTSAPTLTVTYACKPGFVDNGTSCAPAPSVPALPPWALLLLAAALASRIVGPRITARC